MSIGRYKELAQLVQEIRDREVEEEEGKWETKRKKHLDELKEELKEIRRDEGNPNFDDFPTNN